MRENNKGVLAMSKILIIGAGGVAAVTIKKCARLTEMFSEIYLASRTVSKCEALQAEVGIDRVKKVYAVDADHAHIDAVRKVTRGVAITGENGGAVTIFVIHGKAERLFIGFRTHR